ncbi:MAG TPA: transporter, partial [Lacipirellulaceae bacterium]
MQQRRWSLFWTFFAALILPLANSAISASLAQCCGGPDTLCLWCQGEDSGDSGGSKWDDPLQSDRPGFGDCPTTVGCGICQLEMGYQYTYDRDDNSSHINHSSPQSLLRVGTLANWFELRVGWSMEQETDHVFGVSSQTAVGSDDMNVGCKIALTPQDGCLPQTAIVADMFLPTGSSAFTAGEVLPEIEFIYSWALNKKLSVIGVTFLSDAVDDETNHTYLEFSEGVETDLAISDKFGAYTDWHVSSPV